MPDKMVFLKNAADHKALIDQLELLDETVYKAAVLIAGTFRSGGKLIICGNGGSAADAQHMAAELSGRYLKDRKALDAVALNCNSSAITAIANDYSFGDVFARQVEAHGKKGDVLLAISTSGSQHSQGERIGNDRADRFGRRQDERNDRFGDKCALILNSEDPGGPPSYRTQYL